MNDDGFPLEGWYHLCAGDARHCRAKPGDRHPVVHTDRLRPVYLADVVANKIGWAPNGREGKKIKELLGLDGAEKPHPAAGAGLLDVGDVSGARPDPDLAKTLEDLDKELGTEKPPLARIRREVNFKVATGHGLDEGHHHEEDEGVQGGAEQGAEEGNDIGTGGIPHHQVVDRFFAMPPVSLTRLDSSRSPSGVLDG
eukprot:6455929-Amphidinium_carterae.1